MVYITISLTPQTHLHTDTRAHCTHTHTHITLPSSPTTLLAPEKEREGVQLPQFQSSLQGINGQKALVPAVQVTHLLCYSGIAIHEHLEWCVCVGVWTCGRVRGGGTGVVLIGSVVYQSRPDHKGSLTLDSHVH